MKSLSRNEWFLVLLFALVLSAAQILFQFFQNDPSVSVIFQIPFIVPFSVLCGLLMVITMRNSRNRVLGSITVKVDENEIVLKTSGANYLGSGQRVGGKLVLTDRRLILISKTYSVQNLTFETSIDEIRGVDQLKFWKVFDTGLLLDLKKGGRHKFVVDNPGEWILEIRAQQRTKAY